MFLFSCAYAYAYVACVMLIAQVGTRLKCFLFPLRRKNMKTYQPPVFLDMFIFLGLKSQTGHRMVISLRIQPPLIRSRYYVRNANSSGSE